MCVLFSEECVTQVYTTFDASQLFCQAGRLNHLDAMHVFPPTSRSCVVPRHGFLVLRPASWPRPNHLPPRATPAKENSPPAISTHESKQTESRKNGAKHFKTEPKAGLQAVALPSIAARRNKRLPGAHFRLKTCSRLLLLTPATPGNPVGVSQHPGNVRANACQSTFSFSLAPPAGPSDSSWLSKTMSWVGKISGWQHPARPRSRV